MHNREFLASIVHRAGDSDWMATVAFYTALHAVQVLLLADGNNRAFSHETRREILKSERRYSSLWPDYKALYDASCAARYDCSGWLQAEAVRNELIKTRLGRLERQVIKLAKLNLSLPDIIGASPTSDDNSGRSA